MPDYDFKGDVANAAWFQDKYNLWKTELLKRKPVLDMEPKHVKWLYNNDAVFKQFVDITIELNGYYKKVKNALQE